MNPDDAERRGDLHHYVASLDQLSHLLSQPTKRVRPAPITGDDAPEPVDDAELDAELEGLKAEQERL